MSFVFIITTDKILCWMSNHFEIRVPSLSPIFNALQILTEVTPAYMALKALESFGIMPSDITPSDFNSSND